MNETHVAVWDALSARMGNAIRTQHRADVQCDCAGMCRPDLSRVGWFTVMTFHGFSLHFRYEWAPGAWLNAVRLLACSALMLDR